MRIADLKVLGIVWMILILCTACQESIQFRLHFPSQAGAEPITGRAILVLSSDTAIDPDIPNPFRPFITYGRNFKAWKPGEKLVMKPENVDSFLSSMDELNGYYSLRAVLDLDTTSSILLKNGTYYSDEIIFRAEPGKILDIEINNTLERLDFNETSNVKPFKMKSTLLSYFYGTPTYIETAIFLPDSYQKEKEEIYPVVFVFPGWGATHITASQDDWQQRRYGMSGLGKDKVFVLLNQDCRYGYHVFANSDNNGPWMQAFMEEFLPYIENHYRVSDMVGKRFLIGQSSGGWAALWLLINNPDSFAMAWSASPDPVDFRDFLGHNLYLREANFFYDLAGNLTPGVRNTEKNFTNKDWSGMETALGEGGQYQSFEAVFGRNINNYPEQFFDRENGKIFKDAIEHWKQYDISRYIRLLPLGERNKLDGKIHIRVAANDDFYLDGAVKLLKSTLDSLGVISDITILKRGGHDTWNDDTRKEMHRIMDGNMKSVIFNPSK